MGLDLSFVSLDLCCGQLVNLSDQDEMTLSIAKGLATNWSAQTGELGLKVDIA